MNRIICEMTWPEFKDAIEKKPVIIPVGSVEQHGYHLPLHTDAIISTRLAGMLAERIDAVVAPTINYGYKSQPNSGGGPLFPGTIDLNGETLIYFLKDIICEFARDGVKKILVCNGHFENEAFLVEAIDLATQEYPDTNVVLVSWWDHIGKDIVEKVFDEVEFPGWALEHAAIVESSLMMYLEPSLVHMDRFVEEERYIPGLYHNYPVKKGIVPESGVLATARTSSTEKGRILAECIIDAYAHICEDIFG